MKVSSLNIVVTAAIVTSLSGCQVIETQIQQSSESSQLSSSASSMTFSSYVQEKAISSRSNHSTQTTAAPNIPKYSDKFAETKFQAQVDEYANYVSLSIESDIQDLQACDLVVQGWNNTYSKEFLRFGRVAESDGFDSNYVNGVARVLVNNINRNCGTALTW